MDTIQNPTRSSADATVMARVNYLVPGDEKPYSYTYEPPPGKPWRNIVYAPQTMPIHDARRFTETPTLDVAGYAFAAEPTTFKAFDDSAAIERDYHPEVARSVQRATGASHVVVFDHTLRDGANEKLAADGVREPVKRAHNDYTLSSAPQRIRDLLPPAEAEARLARRYVFVNHWRPIRGVVRESPLGVIDARSIAFEDFIGSDLIYRDRIGETYGVRHNPAHRWVYYPDMTPDEVLLLKCFDSATDGRARWTGHAAFDDPTSAPDAPRRRSIETRTIAFYD